MKKKDKETEIVEVKKEKPAKKTKAKKAPKMVLQSKLPRMLKKKYSPKAYEKKLLKHIYISSDLELIKSLFIEGKDDKGKDIVYIDQTKEIEKQKADHLKQVVKQIKKQKPGIRIVPLVATIIFIAAAGIVVTAFKNVVVKKVLVSSLQGIFQAETDIKKVDVQIFGSSLLIENLQQTNKDKLERNLFEIDRISVDFNLTDLLRGKFHAEELAVEGVALNTERKRPGRYIPKKTKDEKQKESQINLAMKEVGDAAVAKLTEMFAAYNPEVMIGDIQNQLKSPALAQDIYKEVNEEIKKWQGTPEKYKTSVDEFTKSVQAVMNTDWSKITDLKKVEEALKTLESSYTEAQKIQKMITETATDLKQDSDKVQSYAKQIEDAIKSDSSLVENKVKEIKTMFSPDGLKSVMNDGIQSMLYEYTGKYYPYVSKVMDMAVSAIGQEEDPEKAAKKQLAKEKKEAKKAKKAARKERMKRDDGINIYYKADTVPKLLVEKVVASGYEYGTDQLLFKGTAENITSDQNMIGKSTKIAADFKVLNHPNNAKIIVDARKASSEPLVTANYNGGGYAINSDAKIFNLKSTSDITAMLTADLDGSFSVGGILDMDVNEMTGMDFEPAMVNRIYKNALGGIKELTIGFEVGYKAGTNDFFVEIKNMDRLAGQLVTPIVNALTQELTVIAEDAKNKALAMLTEKTGIATDSISQFVNINDLINGEKKSMDELTKQLDAKKKELTDKMTKMAKDATAKAVDEGLKKAGIDTSKIPTGDNTKEAADAAKNALEGLKKLKF